MKAHGGGVDARVHISTVTALGRGRVAIPTLGRLHPRRKHPALIYRKLNGPQDQSEHEEVKQNLHSSDTRDRTRTAQPVVKRLAA